MRRKQFLQFGTGAIAIFAWEHLVKDPIQAQGFSTFDKLSSRKKCILTGKIDRIMGEGSTSEVQLLRLLRLNNAPLHLYGDLPNIYREEAAIEGVNYDIAFCQMCLETGFLQFDGDVKAEQNNFRSAF